MEKLLLDNMTLQDVDHLVNNGLQQDSCSAIVVDGGSHEIQQVNGGAIQIESLISLLTAIVLADTIVVDSKWTYVWKDIDHLNPFIQSKDFRGPDFGARRQVAIQQLAVTSSLKEFVDATPSDRDRMRQYMALILGGSAGYLARSSLHSAPYIGHPLRQRLISKSALLNPRASFNYSAAEVILDEIQSTRSKLFRRLNPHGNNTFASFNLPPVAVEIIQDSNTADQLLWNAIELRDKYSGLRRWLADYQFAIESEDTRKQAARIKLLKSVGKQIDNLTRPAQTGSTRIVAGVSNLQISRALNISQPMYYFGIRGVLSNLILEKRGVQAIEKLLRFFTSGRDSLHATTLNALVERYTRPI